MPLIKKVELFTGRKDVKLCEHKHKLQGTGAIFYQSVKLLECIHCGGWQDLSKPIW